MSKEAMKLALEALRNSWTEPCNEQYEFEKEAITALQKALANEALERMAQNARELGLDYDTSAGTQVSKVWWDGEKLMAKSIPLEEFCRPVQLASPPAQRTPLTDEQWQSIADTLGCIITRKQKDAIEAKLRSNNT